ncbi:PDR/VanB family oxidoreductase [Streptomyces sp. NPDC088794]|uniref:PDR/VanB family oxidoreductase n=1 Tax=Streptomyces sp. NPDC088794 TaxID=3365902 RepID=UPI0038080344
MQVASLERPADRIVSIELEPACGSVLPSWEPGSHIDVHLAQGLVRQYSLSLAPRSGRWRLGVLEEADGRGGSSYIHRMLRVGDRITVSRPRNTFPFELRGRPVIFVVGGIGITPILSMVAEAASATAAWSLLYLTRSPEATAFADELAAYEHRVKHHYDSTAGIIDLPTALDDLGGREADIYACGPPALLSALETYAASRQGCRLVVERFSGGGTTQPQPDDQEFVVELADGTEIVVPADESILEALAREGVPLLSSCQEGVCGTCETAVLAGRPDHRDHVLTEDERASGEMIMPCVSRCLGSRIRLDL